MDRTQLIAFCDYMIGGRVVGGSAEEPTETPHSPELHAFILARLGDNMPVNGYSLAFPLSGGRQIQRWAEAAKAFAALLREVADGIDPIPAAPDENLST